MTEVREGEKAKLEAAKKTLEEQTERVKESTERNNKRMNESRPTPTQEEANLSALGVPITKHDDDGSGPEPVRETVFKQSEAKPGSGGSYQTRSHNPQPQHRPEASPKPEASPRARSE